MPKLCAYPLLLVVFVALQAGFWWQTQTIRPVLAIVPEVPAREVVEIAALGDTQFLFRALALRLQHAGDTFGRVSPLKNYDYEKLVGWFTLLDGMDSRSDLLPTLAAHYYSQTQKTADVRYIVDYLHAHSMRDVTRKWWWLVQAVYLANHKLEDKALALALAAPLPGVEAAPIWARQMPAFIHEQRGEVAEALAIMQGIQDNVGELSDRELRFMEYFVEERLRDLEQKIEHAPQEGGAL